MQRGRRRALLIIPSRPARPHMRIDVWHGPFTAASHEAFVSSVWQKRPLIIRGFLSGKCISALYIKIHRFQYLTAFIQSGRMYMIEVFSVASADRAITTIDVIG